MINILDCTLRDGGYISDWNFSNKNVVTFWVAHKKLEMKSNLDFCGVLINGY